MKKESVGLKFVYSSTILETRDLTVQKKNQEKLFKFQNVKDDKNCFIQKFFKWKMLFLIFLVIMIEKKTFFLPFFSKIFGSSFQHLNQKTLSEVCRE